LGARVSAERLKEFEGTEFKLSSYLFLDLSTGNPQDLHNGLGSESCTMNGFFIALAAVALLLSILACLFAAAAAAQTRELRHLSPSLVESRVTSLETSLAEWTETVRALADRVKMQRVRNAVSHATKQPDNPDPYTNPDEWRKVANRQLALSHLRGKPQ
jgi:hypothetical protein